MSKTNYIDNAKFLAELSLHRKAVRRCVKERTKPPGINHYLGVCFLEMARRMASRPNFSGYPYKEEMIGDAIENCIQYVCTFDPKKSSNPFGFFSRVIWTAFLRRLKKEKHELAIKLACVEKNDPSGKFRSGMKMYELDGLREILEHGEKEANRDPKAPPKPRGRRRRHPSGLDGLYE